MLSFGYAFFCILVLIISGIYAHRLINGKNLTPKYKKKIQLSLGVLIFIAVALLFFGIDFLHITFLPTYVISIVLSIILNSFLLTLIFNKLQESFHYPLLKIIYYIGITFIFLTSFTIYQGGYGLSFEPTIVTAILVIASSIAVGVMMLFFKAYKNLRSGNVTFNNFPQAFTNKDKIQHYYDQGLNDSEIEYFRSQMAVARDQIKSIESGVNQTAKLRAIEVRYNTIEVLQNFFKDIVEEPTRFTQASQFLYKFLPSLEDLIQKYNEINGHVAKNKQTYLILERSAQTIEQICEQITDEYVLFHEETYKEMQDEIKLANRNLSRKAARQNMNQGQDSDSIADTVSDILKESNDWLDDNNDI